MEKISGIIPASPRTRAVDTSASQPARPGAPAFGRPMGKNSLGDRVTLSKHLEEVLASGDIPTLPEPVTYKNPIEAKKNKVIEDLNAKFFTNVKHSVRGDDLTKSEEILAKTNDIELSPSVNSSVE